MGLTTALYTGLSGMTTSSEAITVTGNNIANSNTTSFKAGRIAFETQISQTIRNGSAPSGDIGGINPSQVGLGVRTSGITRNFNTGSINPTGVNTDLAIEGNGFFVLNLGGVTRYTRDGSFQLDANFNLVRNGGLVQGYGVDDSYDVIEGPLGNITVPIGDGVAEATSEVRFAGNLNAGGDVATIGALATSGPLTDFATSLAATGTTLLTNLRDSGSSTLFTTGDVLTVTGVKKGGASLPDKTFEIGASNTTDSTANGTTLDDLLGFLDDIFGIDPNANATAGVTVDSSGQIVVAGNSGSVNNLEVQTGNFIVNAGGASPSLPFTFDQSQTADGESVRTTFVAYDSLGTPLTIDLTMTLVDKTTSGTTWRYDVQSEDDTDVDRVLGSGTIEFDNDGQLLTQTNPSFTINRDLTGASSPQLVTMAITGPEGTISSLTDTQSRISATSQNGSSFGTLQSFSVTEDGLVVGVYSNSLLRTLGQVTLAMFSNPQGLVETGGNLFDVTVNSGTPQIVTAGSGGSGRVVGGALELSNVDLSAEFINLISASTGFSASSRVVTTSDRLIQELLATAR
ncbi:MAG: flagellar hook-basal body complex protein [Phycisphaera sp.]|nr:flagellar hook-basal body complex protein [Phycisphaera sp.]